MAAEIIVTIKPDGTVQVEANGTKGKLCEALTKPIEDALGVEAGKKYKPEYHQRLDQQQNATAGN